MSSSYEEVMADPVWRVAGAAIRLTLLGRFRLEQNGQAARLRTRKAESLLAYLVLHPGRHTREVLAELFWGDTPELQARASLRAALADVRNALGPDALLSDRVVIECSPSAGIWVDVLEFRAQAEAFLSQELADPDGFNPGLYGGELLAGHYDDWVLVERDSLRQLYLDALLHQVARLRSLSRYEEAMAAAHRVLAADAAEERAHQHLIFLYGATGNRPAALRQLEVCRRNLKEELDVEPSAETLALADSVAAAAVGTTVNHAGAEISPRPAEPGNLPTPLTSFVGREHEMAALSEFLLGGAALSGGCRLLTLTGAGGSGKTRLAIQLARLLARNYRHGAWWVDLSSVHDPALVPDAVLLALGVAPAPGQPPMQTLTGFLRGRILLLALDNCEHLAEACARLVQSVLQACPAVQVLATSCEPLDVPGEQLWPVPTFSVPAATDHLDAGLDMAALLGYDAVRLFVERARMHRPTFRLEAGNADQVAEICRRLDGIPLAIELAAARVRTMELDDILARLQNRLRLLASASTLAPPRHQTLRASIDWSYNLLSPAECLLLQRLAVFVGGWSLATAEAICSDGNLAREDILDLLARLVDRSLVVAEGRRYRLLETIREYALERLVDAGEDAALRDSHAVYFAAYLGERCGAILGNEQHRAVAEITAEIGNVRAACGWAVAARRYDLLGTAIRTLQWYDEIQYRFYDGEAAYARAVHALANDPAAPPDLLALLRAIHGYYLGRLGRLKDARQELEQGCAQLRQAGAPADVAQGLVMLAAVLWQEGDFAAARALLEESLGMCRTPAARMLTALCLFFLGLVEHSMGNYVRAGECFRETLEIGRAVGQPRVVAMTSVYGSKTLLALGKIDEARERLEEGLALARRGGDRWLVGSAMGHMGMLLNAQGSYARAREVLFETVALAEECGNRWDRAWGEVCLGDAELGLGDADQADVHYRSGLQEALAVDALPVALDALAGMAELRARAGDRERALEIARQVALHPAGAGNARTRATQVLRMLDLDYESRPAAAEIGAFDRMVQGILGR